MSQNIDFLVSEVVAGAGAVNAHGICAQGTIHVNTMFTGLRKKTEGEGVTQPAYLTVLKIVAYRREIDELPKGMGGSLHLVGDDASGLASGDVLVGTAGN